MKIKVKPQIHNRFDIFVKDIRTGQEEQVAYAENIILDHMWDRLCAGSTYFTHIHYGDGVLGGENEMKSSNTKLFNKLGDAAATTDATVRGTPDDPTSYWRRYITLGLGTANDKSLSEVGIAYGSTATNLVTHALIRDMNGNITTLNKNQYKTVTIYATVYVSLINDHASIKLVRPKFNGLISYLLGESFPIASFYASMSQVSATWPAGSILNASFGSVSDDWINDINNKKRKTKKITFNTSQVNGNAINEIGFSNIARLRLPTVGIYSGLELSNIPIGTGDALEDTFELPSFLADKDSVVIKVNNVIVGNVNVFQKDNYARKKTFYGGYPGNNVRKCRFSADGKYLAVASNNSPRLSVYELIDGSYVKILYGGNDIGSGAHDVVFSHDNKYLAVAHSGSPYLTLFEMVNGIYTRIDYSGSLGSITLAYSVAFSSDSKYLAVGFYPSPYFAMYELIDGVYTNISRPGSYSGAVQGVAFSPNGSYMVNVSGSALSLFKKSSGAYVAESFNGGNPGSTCRDVRFSHDGKYIAVATQSSPYLVIYELISGVYTRVSYSGAAPGSDAYGVAFSHNSKYLVLTAQNSPYMSIYELVEGTYTKTTYSGGDLGNSSYGVDISHDSKFIAATIYSSPYLNMYELFVNCNTLVKFDSPPANGAVITADYTVKGIHKTNQRVIDLQAEIQFGEPEEEEEDD